MLTGNGIRAAGLILNGTDSGYRASSYDVRIEHIIAEDGALRDSFKMPPQGIVQVISFEQVRLSNEMTGLAYVKTGLCNEGLLALKMGIIDPGYEGRISSFLVNFSNSSRMLVRGEPFLRLQFMPMDESVRGMRSVDDHSYIADRRKQSAIYSSTFLNLAAVVEKTTNDLFSKWRSQILAIAGSIALVLTVLTFLLNWGSLYLVKNWLQPADAVRAELLRGSLNDQDSKLIKANEEFARRIEALEARLRPNVPSPSKP